MDSASRTACCRRATSSTSACISARRSAQGMQGRCCCQSADGRRSRWAHRERYAPWSSRLRTWSGSPRASVPSERLRVAERQLVCGRVEPDDDRPAVLEPAEQDLISQRIPHLALDYARERARAEHRIEPFHAQPRARFRLERDCDPPFRELRLELEDELPDDRLHHHRRERLERHDRIQPVAELRREYLLRS